MTLHCIFTSFVANKGETASVHFSIPRGSEFRRLSITPDKSYEAASQRTVAMDLCQQAFELQMRGEYQRALNVYQRSIELDPTPEAYTFLGWTYGSLGKYAEAIRSCAKAINLDPESGTPYHDIGIYQIELGRPDEAIFWLEAAIKAPRYEGREHSWYNLGRVYESRRETQKARECYARALAIYPEYALAEKALLRLIARDN